MGFFNWGKTKTENTTKVVSHEPEVARKPKRSKPADPSRSYYMIWYTLRHLASVDPSGSNPEFDRFRVDVANRKKILVAAGLPVPAEDTVDAYSPFIKD